MCNFQGKEFIDKSPLMQKYQKHLLGQRRSQETINAYMMSLGLFFNYKNFTTDDEIMQATADDVRTFLDYIIIEKEQAVTTRNLRCAAIKQFYEYLRKIEKVSTDRDIEDFDSIKPPIKESIYLDEVEAEQIILSATKIRSKLILSLLLRTGIRVSELINIKLSKCKKNKEDKFGRMCYSIVIQGKGNKERTMFVDYELTQLIDKYVNGYVDKLGKHHIGKRQQSLDKANTTSEYLFISNYGNQMNRSNIRKMIQIYGLKIDFDQAIQLSPHKLRHSYATKKLEDGWDIKTVSVSLGHSNIATTNRYVHTNKKKVAAMQMGE